MEFFQNNAIAGIPMPGPYYIYNYFAHAHPILCIKKYLRFDKITFSMILINISWSSLTPQQYFISMMRDINMNDFLTRQYITMGHSVRFSISFPLREG